MTLLFRVAVKHTLRNFTIILTRLTQACSTTCSLVPEAPVDVEWSVLLFWQFFLAFSSPLLLLVRKSATPET